MQKKITIEVTADGEIKVEGHNFKGLECEKAMKAFEEGLGAVTSKVKKPEAFQTATQRLTA